ncbi:uncharacterized protein LOC100822852 [Brachypodium distachyon]|uniref:FCP1 homology domain-containing protein n=1 Tax=Brachypodium distachyon TaxID=15368 RepID=I1HQ57_BRADI|nr:uncharacterized protein LOC100822852 [Brachypodium distachyon]KQK09074.1 hypothetical protein BRADI_2g45880v3 [Brachypodium distachyon]|eukprot:XP_003569513.1 uncharacterized protein LOC100822852 [Brachypodium distachyon]
MPALIMKRKFDDDIFGNEVDTKSMKSMKISHSEVDELEQAAVMNSFYNDPHHDADPEPPLAGQGTGITEAAGLHAVLGGTSIDLLKDVISEAVVSPADSTSDNDGSISQLNAVNNVDEGFADQDANYSLHDICTVNDNEGSWGLNQGCSLLDIYNPDDAFPFLLDVPIDLLASYSALCDEFVPFDALIDMTGRCGVFPLNESTAEASIGNETCSSMGNVSDNNSAGECFSSSEVLEWLNPYVDEEDLPNLIDYSELSSDAACVSKEQGTKKVTLVLDLDETLVHSTMEHCSDADFTFPVFFDMKEHVVYVRKRPHLHIFLQKMAEMFDVVIFTASQSVYADQLLDRLDPEKTLFCKRFFRESCVFTESGYTKDLTVVGVDLAKVVIIDNTPQVFQLQVNNGIPIQSWYNDPSDEGLPQLIPFLERLAVADDVRPIISKKFGDTKDNC